VSWLEREPRRPLDGSSGMAKRDSLARIWTIIERVGVCMLTTHAPDGFRARPLEARPDRENGIIWFVTDRHSGKEHEIQSAHDIGLVFVDAEQKAYLSLTARAEVLEDHARARAIWKATDNMWWRGPDDPNVCVLRVDPLTAELWDGPASKAVAIYEFVKSQVTGALPALGENRKTTIDLR
jgi:general stress protein 26